LPGGTGAIQFHDFEDGFPQIDWVRWDYTVCSPEMMVDGDCVPFGADDGLIFSVGYIAVLFIFVPMALMDLKVR
jgi:hypothetical protein